jgi:uncharacterized membrane protein YbhN (UPF0104 family)
MAAEPLARRWIAAIAVSTAVAAAIYLVAVLWAGHADVSRAFKAVGADTLFALLALSCCNYGLRAARWHYYLHRLGTRISFAHDLRIYIAGFALTTTPGKAGEMARSVWLMPYGVKPTISLAAFFAERIQDFLAILLLASAGASLYRGGFWMLGLSFAIVVAAMLVLFIPAATRWPLAMLGQRAGAIGLLAARITEVLRLTRGCMTPGRFAVGMSVGLCAWGCEACAFFLLLQAMHAPLSLVTAVSIYAFAMLAGAVSFMPGGLGGSEATMVLLLTVCRVPLPTAVSATLVIRVATLWFAVLLGIAALAMRFRVPAAPGLARPAVRIEPR